MLLATENIMHVTEVETMPTGYTHGSYAWGESKARLALEARLAHI